MDRFAHQLLPLLLDPQQPLMLPLCLLLLLLVRQLLLLCIQLLRLVRSASQERPTSQANTHDLPHLLALESRLALGNAFCFALLSLLFPPLLLTLLLLQACSLTKHCLPLVPACLRQGTHTTMALETYLWRAG